MFPRVSSCRSNVIYSAAATGSISEGSLLRTLPTRGLTGQQITADAEFRGQLEDVRGDPFGIASQDVSDEDFGAFVREQASLRLTHPMRAAGDNRNFVF
jgi:hypothetical protein